ncbi:MAG: YceH family protein [Bacteroidota bacterium]|nr:YceH family protein [Bacteroidota bacterium]
MDLPESLPVLNSIEIRVLGSLIEKSKTTPDYYPMTLNSLTAACNQKSSRKPVVQYDEETVVIALNSLKKNGLISTATGGTSRSVKYKHNFTLVFPLTTAELAVMCLLFLRGPQTAGEINTNSARLHEFESLEEVLAVLEKLAHADLPLVQQLPKRAGQKEVRYTHLLGETIDFEEEELPEEPARKSVNEMEARLTIVEQELAVMKESLEKLMKELMG